MLGTARVRLYMYIFGFGKRMYSYDAHAPYTHLNIYINQAWASSPPCSSPTSPKTKPSTCSPSSCGVPTRRPSVGFTCPVRGCLYIIYIGACNYLVGGASDDDVCVCELYIVYVTHIPQNQQNQTNKQGCPRPERCFLWLTSSRCGTCPNCTGT
jgi:hypothetical protein